MQLKSIARNQVLRQRELARALGTTEQTIFAWRKEGLRPFYQHGGYLLFRLKDVEDWLYKRRLKRTTPTRWAKATRARGAANGR